jgi:hypothetical protein
MTFTTFFNCIIQYYCYIKPALASMPTPSITRRFVCEAGLPVPPQNYTGLKVPAQTCQAKRDLATRLRTM